MRFLLVDRILEWTPGQSIATLKNVSMSEDFLEFHFPKYPVMPGVMLTEALAQSAAWLEGATSDFENWLLLENVRKASFYGFALPGDQVRIQIDALPCETPGLKAFRGAGRVDDRKCVIAEFEMRIVPMADLESPEEQRMLFRVLTRELSRLSSKRSRPTS